MQFDDRDLLVQAQANPENYGPLYDKYMEKIYRYFWYRTGQQNELAEDCMQETFLRAFKHVSSFTDKGISYFSYLLTIAHNLLVNHYRWTEANKAVFLDDVDEAVFSFSSDVEDHLDDDVIWSAVADLTIGERDILTLRYQHEMSIREIAQAKGKTENAVKLILCRAKKKLKNNPALVALHAEIEHAYSTQ